MSGGRENNGTYELITPPNTLKERVGAGNGIDASLVKNADAAVRNMHGKFVQRVTDAIDDIAEQIALAEKSEDDGHGCAAEVSRISRDLQLRGEAYGYPLVGDICVSLSSYIENLDAPEDMAGNVVCPHTDAIREVVGNHIEGDGGRVGQDLVDGLIDLVNRSLR